MKNSEAEPKNNLDPSEVQLSSGVPNVFLSSHILGACPAGIRWNWACFLSRSIAMSGSPFSTTVFKKTTFFLACLFHLAYIWYFNQCHYGKRIVSLQKSDFVFHELKNIYYMYFENHNLFIFLYLRSNIINNVEFEELKLQYWKDIIYLK